MQSDYASMFHRARYYEQKSFIELIEFHRARYYEQKSFIELNELLQITYIFFSSFLRRVQECHKICFAELCAETL